MPIESSFFIDRFAEQIRRIRPVPTALHIKSRMFILKNLDSCWTVFLHTTLLVKSREPPYSGPYRIIKRATDWTFVIDINGEHKTISIDRLKPAFLPKNDDDE